MSADVVMEPMSPRRLHYGRDIDFYKVCCAICGTVLTMDSARRHVIVNRDGMVEESTQAHSYDSEEDTPRLTSWLGNIRLITDFYNQFHQMDVELSDLVTFERNGWFETPDIESSLPYYRCEADRYIIPLHDECLQILQKYLAPADINLGVLYDTLIGLCEDKDTCISAMSLGTTSRYQAAELLGRERHIGFRRGVEYLSKSPMDIPELSNFYEALPQLEGSGSGTESLSRALGASSSDPFSALAHELLFMIASHMDIKSLLRWRTASPATAKCHFPNHLWRNIVCRNTGWLFDLPQFSCREAELKVDWKCVCKTMYLASNPSNKNRIDGLVNRRYIWEEQCPQIANPYAFKLSHKNVGFRKLQAQIPDLSLRRGELLTRPDPIKITQHCPTLFDDLTQLQTIEPVLIVSWTEAGDLASIDIEKEGRCESTHHKYLDDREAKDKVGRVERVPIPQHDWLLGLRFEIQTGECWARNSLNTNNASDDEVDPGSRRIVMQTRRITGVTVFFNKQERVWLGQQGDRYEVIRATANEFIVGLTMTRRTYRGTITHAAVIDAPVAYCQGLQRFIEQS